MMRRREVTLGAVLSFSIWVLASCGGGTSTPPTAPSVTLSGSSLTFVAQLVGTKSAAQGITVTNSGNAALTVSGVAISGTNGPDFGETDNCTTSSVAAGATCTITVTFTPSATGSRSASLTITDNASGSPQSVSLSGTGTAPAVTISPSPLTFSGQLVETTSSTQTVTVTNSGTANLTITSLALGGTNPGDFATSADTCTGANVAASATCTVKVSFTPTATGSRAASLAFADNASGSPQSLAITGTGTAPAVTLSAPLTFATQLVATTSAAQTVTVTNSGTGPLNITTLSLGGANPGDFATSADTCTGASVAPSATCTVNVTFAPTASGSRAASLAFADNASGSPQSLSLTGTAIDPAVTLSPTSLTFASQVVDTTSATQTATVTNSGTTTLNVTGISLVGTNPGDFLASADTCTGASVAPSATCTVNIAFKPTAAGSRTASLAFADNALASPQSVPLTGTAAVAFPTVSGTVTKGAVSGATVTIYLVNADGSNGAVIGTGTTGSDGSFSVTLTALATGPVRVVVTGGTYPSEWDGKPVTSSSTVSALIDDVGTGTLGISVTAVSTFVDTYASGRLAHGTSTSFTSAHAAAEALIISYYGFTATITVETLPPSFSSSSIGTDGFKLGLIVGTLTAEGSFVVSTDPDSLLAALAADIADGVWDGLTFGTTISLGTSGLLLPSTAGTSDFSSDLGTYVTSSTSTTSNGVTTSNASSAINSIDSSVATCTCTPAAVGLAATSSGAINSLSFTPSNATSAHQFLFVAARSSGVVAVDITDPTLTTFPVKVWQQLFLNNKGSGGFGGTDVGGVIPFVGSAGHPQLLALAYGSKHILVLNADKLVTGTPWTDNPVDAEMDVPIRATSEVQFSGGSAFIGSGVPLGGSLLALATADGYMIFDASQVGLAGGNPVLKVYPVQDPAEIIAENLGGDPTHKYLLGGNEGANLSQGGVQLVDLGAGATNGTSYYITNSQFSTLFPGTYSTEVDANSVDPSLQVGIFTFEDTGDAELVNMSSITKTVSTTPGVLNSWAPAAAGVAHVTLGSAIISGSAVDPTTHLALFMAGYSSDMAVGQIQDPASVPSGSVWQGLSDSSSYTIISSPSLSSFAQAHDPHADGVVFNLMENTPYGYELDGSNLGVLQTDLAGFLAIAHPAGQPGTDPTTVTNTTTHGLVMQEISWVLPLGITSTSLPTGNVGSSYFAGLTEVNGTGPFTWSTDSAGTTALTAAGLALSSTGSISGTPTTVGSVAFTLTVTDSSVPALTASAPITLYVDAPPPSITTTSLTPAFVNVGAAYSATVTATAGQTPYMWSITTGALPTGITLNAGTGVISGTPTITGAANFTVTVTDSSPIPQMASQPLSITVNNTTAMNVPGSITLPSGSTYAGYRGNIQNSITGGTPPFSCGLTSGTLPAGLSFDTNNSCLIVGVPTAAGTATVGLAISDSTAPSPATGPTSVTVTINTAANNAELNGQYAFVLNGSDSNGYPMAMAGSFTADGAGNITAGVVDTNDSLVTPTASLTFTGNYGVGSDNRGGMVVTDANNLVHTFLFSVGQITSGVAGKADIIGFDSNASVSGIMHIQDATAFKNSALASSYAFAMVGGTYSDTRFGIGGVFTADGVSALSNGETDYNVGGTVGSATFAGSYSVPTASPGTTNGRGTASFVLPSGTVNFAFYVVDATHLYLVSTDSSYSSVLTSVFSGAAAAQSVSSFSNSSLNGISVFATEGQNGAGSYGSPASSNVQAGLLTFDGAGNYTLSSDENKAGTVQTKTDSGTYSVEANGRVTITSSSSTGNAPVFYLGAPGEGFIIGTDSDSALGLLAPQTGSSFTNASFSGSYLFGSSVGGAPVFGSGPTSGMATADGAGNISGTSDSSDVSSNVIYLDPDEPFTDTYSVSGNGRVTLGSGDMVFYMLSTTDAVGINVKSTNQQPTITFVGPHLW